MTPYPQSLLIRLLISSDIPRLIAAFQKAHWPKPASLFEAYYQEQRGGERCVWIAYAYQELAGYVTLVWNSLYAPFADESIPEIMDLNVLPSFRNAGIGSALLDTAEKKAGTRHDEIGIGVGLYGGLDGGYGSAQKLYVKRGYVPDGKGVTYHYKPAVPGQNYPLDDDLVLWWSKKL